MKIEKSLYRELGAVKKSGMVKSITYNRILNALDDCITEQHWLAFHGPIGSGKTETVEDCLEQLDKKYGKKVRFINLYWPERSGINIAEIHNQIIYSHGEEYIGTSSPKRGKEIRALQVLEILVSMKAQGHAPVLIIDEAHELHYMTLKALKRLREYRFKGKKDLLSIVLIGQEKLEKKIHQDKEVRLRCYPSPVDYTQREKEAIATHHLPGSYPDLAKLCAERFETVGDIVMGIRQAMVKAIKLDDARLTDKHFTFPKPVQQKKKASQKVDHSSLADIESRLTSQSQSQSKNAS